MLYMKGVNSSVNANEEKKKRDTGVSYCGCVLFVSITELFMTIYVPEDLEAKYISEYTTKLPEVAMLAS